MTVTVTKTKTKAKAKTKTKTKMPMLCCRTMNPRAAAVRGEQATIASGAHRSPPYDGSTCLAWSHRTTALGFSLFLSFSLLLSFFLFFFLSLYFFV